MLFGILANTCSVPPHRAATCASLSAISLPSVPAWALTQENLIRVFWDVTLCRWQTRSRCVKDRRAFVFGVKQVGVLDLQDKGMACCRVFLQNVLNLCIFKHRMMDRF